MVSKVSGAGSSKGVGSSKKSGGKKSAGGDFKASLDSAIKARAEAEEVSATENVSAVNPLLMLQEVGDFASKGKRIKEAFNVLDYLDEIRVGILDGKYSADRLKQLDELVQTWREKTEDQRLNNILDEIELRARIELAKIGSY